MCKARNGNTCFPERSTSTDWPKKISILIADDHPLIRVALRNILDKQADLAVVGEASDGEEAIKLAIELVPDVVIMDIGMPKINGLEATRQIKKKIPHVAILVLTIHGESEHVFGILEAGAAGYLTKAVFGEEIVNAIRGVASGETVLSPSIAQLIVRHASRLMAKPLNLGVQEKLTIREQQILRLVAWGKCNKDIALTLQVSLGTVKGYLSNIFSKLRASSRTEAVVNGVRAGILTVDDILSGNA